MNTRKVDLWPVILCRWCVLSIFLQCFLAGCSLFSTGKSAPNEIKQDLVFEQASIERHYSEGGGNAKLDIVLHYPKAKSATLPIENGAQSEVLAESFNKSLEQSLVEIVKSYMPDETDSTELESNLSEIAQQLGASYEEAYAKASFKPQWAIKIDAKVDYKAPRVLNLSISDHVYLGGAHGTENTHLKAYQLPEMSELSLPELVLDLASARKIAEVQFRVLRQLDASVNLSDSGYTFEQGGEFSLPENIGISKEGLVFVYNPYEIAPYSEGQIVLVVPFNKLTNILTPRAKFILGLNGASGLATHPSSNLDGRDSQHSVSQEESDLVPTYIEPEKARE